MSDATALPRIDWPQLLLAAPYFSSAVFDVLDNTTAASAAPLARAAYYYGQFDGEVSNGGVMQYFFNQAFRDEAFGRAPAFIAENPILAAAMPFVTQVHAAWDEVALDVIKARAKDDWPEELFSAYHERFDGLETAFFAVNHDISQRLCADMVQRPEAYFDIEPLAEVPAKGVAHVVLGGGRQRLRFQDGFPVGPNMFEQDDGACTVVWFSRDRQLMTSDTGYGGSRKRDWIHYPGLASGSYHRRDDGSVTIGATRSLWTRHGLSETFRLDGSREHVELHRGGQAVWSEMFYYPDGTPNLRVEDRPDGEHATRFWPNGAVNSESLDDGTGRKRYLRCLAEDGTDLAPGGTGRFHECLSRGDDRMAWREGRLVGGYLDGDLVWKTSKADGSQVEETGRGVFRDGRAEPAP